MKLSLQQKKMTEIYCLIKQDLCYIYGERESGPNGAKKEFLNKSSSFLRQLGKDLGFEEMKVDKNPAGIAVSGEVTLYGIWSKENGLSFKINQNFFTEEFLYREIKSLKDFTGRNQWIPYSIFAAADYKRLCDILLKLKQEEKYNAA